MKNLSEEEKIKIKELYLSGLKIRLVSKTTKIAERTISAFLKESGLTRNARKSQEELMEIKLKAKELYELNMSVEEIAHILNLNHSTTGNYLRSIGVKLDKGLIASDKKLGDYKQQIKELYEKGFNSYEIGEKLGKSYRTVLSHLKTMGIERRSVKKIDDNRFQEMWNNGATDDEFMKEFNIARATIRGYRIRHNCHVTQWFSQTEQKLSEIQEQMILGSLLGDLSIRYNPKGKNASLCLVHCEKQKELFMEKVRILDEFMGKYNYSIPKPDYRTGKIYPGYRGWSKSHPIFKELYDLLYPNNKKTITEEYLNMIHHPIALAYWFMDDGTYNGTISADSFTEPEIDMLVKFLKNKFGIFSHKRMIKNNRFIIFLEKETRLLFDSIIEPYFVENMKYKLKIQRNKSVVC